MRSIVALFTVCQLIAINLSAADVPSEIVAAAQQCREEILLGGDFKPDPKLPVFVAVGHGGRILLSRDDGQSWKQVYWGYAGSDHGPWARGAVESDCVKLL